MTVGDLQDKFVSLDAAAERKKLKNQMNVYSFQFKLADTVFQKVRLQSRMGTWFYSPNHIL